MKYTSFTFFLLIFINSTLFSQNTILWKITKGGSEQQSYLLGTYHQLGSHFLDSFPLIKTKLLETDVAIFESLQLTKERTFILNRPDNFAYKKYLNKKYAKTLQSIAKTWRYPLHKLTFGEISLIIEKEYFKHNCGNYLQNDSVKLQLDDYLQYFAVDNNLKVLGLENDSLQVTALNKHFKFNKVSRKNLKKKIIFWINALQSAKDHEGLCTLPRMYKSLSLPYEFEKACSENDFVIKARNEAWTSTIISQLNDNNCFIAVGFNHLCFECGLIEILKKNGFELTPIKLKD
jgi:uncharacterized protein YbaP (TraB family)